MNLEKRTHRVMAAGVALGLSGLVGVDPQLVEGAGPALVAFAGCVSNIAAGLVGTDLLDSLRERGTDREALLRNHDLAIAVARSIRVGIEDYSDGHAEAPALQTVAARLEDDWPELIDRPGRAALGDEEMARFQGEGLTRLIGSPEEHRSPLSTAGWLALLRYAHRRARVTLRRDTLNQAAAHLSKQFVAIFVEHVKRSFATGGGAYPAFVLLLLGELHGHARAHAGQLDALRTELEEFEGAMLRVVSKLGADLDAAARVRHRKTLELVANSTRGLARGQEALRAQLEGAVDSAEAGLSRIDDRIAECRDRLNSLHRLPTAPTLRLSLRQPRDPGQSGTRRLEPEHCLIELTGRDEELRLLAAWAEDAPDLSIRVLSGSAGTGKTRLAMDACRYLARRGWQAGFAGIRALEEFLATPATEWVWDVPVFIVIDYAGERTTSVESLLRSLNERRDRGGTVPPLRLLLLERHSGAGAHWWDELLAPSSGGLGASCRRCTKRRGICTYCRSDSASTSWRWWRRRLMRSMRTPRCALPTSSPCSIPNTVRH